jgi:hypothetical protein
MKKFLRFVFIANLLFILTFAAFAQKQMSKDEMFQQIAKLTNTKKAEDQAKAYKLGKEFLAQYGKETDEKVKKIQDFVVKYRLAEFNKALDEVRIADAETIGKEILADEPENTYVTMNLAYGGYEALTKKKDNSFGAMAISYAKKTLSLFEAGKVPKEFTPFKDQADATALMYFVIGNFLIDSDLKEAAKNFYQATKYESQVKKSTYSYYIIAFYYERKYANMAAEYQKQHGAKTAEDDAMKKDQEALNQTVDRMIDAYARAVKLGEATNDPSLNTWKTRLIEVYKFRKGSDDGLGSLLDKVLTTELPEPI